LLATYCMYIYVLRINASCGRRAIISIGTYFTYTFVRSKLILIRGCKFSVIYVEELPMWTLLDHSDMRNGRHGEWRGRPSHGA
jgi:hypothetical protein